MTLIHGLVVGHEKGILTELEESTTGTSTKRSYRRKILSKRRARGWGEMPDMADMADMILSRHQTEKSTSSGASTLLVHPGPQIALHDRAYKIVTSESVISSDEDATLR